MSTTILNEVRPGFYLDSVALMRLSREIAGLPGVVEAALMMGTPANKQIMADAGLLADSGKAAEPGDLVRRTRGFEFVAPRPAAARFRIVVDSAFVQRLLRVEVHRDRRARVALPGEVGVKRRLGRSGACGQDEDRAEQTQLP